MKAELPYKRNPEVVVLDVLVEDTAAVEEEVVLDDIAEDAAAVGRI